MAKYIRPDEDYLSFHSRFSVIEDLIESEFHIPEPLAEGEKCVSCGATAEIQKFITLRKSNVIDSNPTCDRVASEYKTVSLPFCVNCITPSSRERMDWSGLYILGFILVLIVGSLLLFQIGMNMPNVGVFGTMGPGIMVIIAIIVWPGVVTLTAFILSRRDERKKIAKFNRSTTYQTHVLDYIDRMTKDGWQYVFDDESLYDFKLMPEKAREFFTTLRKYQGTHHAPSMTEKEYMNLLCFVEPGVCTLFRGEIGIPQDIIRDFSIFDVNGLGMDETTSATPAVTECIRCGTQTDQDDEILLYREVLVGDEETIKGLAREFGTVKLPCCPRCREKEKKRKALPLGGIRWLQFIFMLLPMFTALALMWVGLTALQDSNTFNPGSGFFETLLMVIGALIVVVIFLILCIRAGIGMGSLCDYIENRMFTRKHRRIIAALEEPFKYGWSDMLPPYFRIEGFSSRLEEWLESHLLYCPIDDAWGQD